MRGFPFLPSNAPKEHNIHKMSNQDGERLYPILVFNYEKKVSFTGEETQEGMQAGNKDSVPIITSTKSVLLPNPLLWHLQNAYIELIHLAFSAKNNEVSEEDKSEAIKKAESLFPIYKSEWEKEFGDGQELVVE